MKNDPLVYKLRNQPETDVIEVPMPNSLLLSRTKRAEGTLPGALSPPQRSELVLQLAAFALFLLLRESLVSMRFNLGETPGQ